MKKDDDWKEKIAREWNEAADDGGAAEGHRESKKKDDDNKSVISY